MSIPFGERSEPCGPDASPREARNIAPLKAAPPGRPTRTVNFNSTLFRHYSPESFLISFSLFSASIGVSELISRPRI